MRSARLPATLLTAAVLAGAAGGCRAPGAADGAPRPYAVAMVRAGGRAGVRLRVRPGEVAVLDGAESGTDRGGGGLCYRWRQAAGPRARLARPDLARTEVLLAEAGLYRFELLVSCGRFRSAPSTVTVEAGAEEAVLHDPPAAGAARHPPAAPAETADFALLESDAGELVRVFGAKTGLTLRVDPGWLRPEEFAKRPLTFMARGVPPGLALEMAARLVGGAYVRDRTDAAFLTAGLGWLRSERQEARFYSTVALGAPERMGPLEALVRESCRGALFACPDSRIVFDRGRVGLQVSGPASLHRRAVAVMGAISSAGRRLPARPPLSAEERLERRVLGRPVRLNLVAREYSEAALELGRVLKVALAWEGSGGGGRAGPPRVSLRGGGRPARRVIEEFAAAGGFKGFSWVRGGGVWLWRSEPRAPSAAHLWGAAEVRAYPLIGHRARGILPGAAAHAVRKGVWPATWRDPATLCSYYKPAGALIVIHAPEVQREVLRLLHDLLEEKPGREPEKKEK